MNSAKILQNLQKRINVNTFQMIPQNKTWRNNCIILFMIPQEQQHLNHVKTRQRKNIDEKFLIKNLQIQKIFNPL